MTLPSEVRVAVLRKLLVELPSEPNKFLGEVVVPLAIRAYRFEIQDKANDTHWFVFHLDGVDPAARPDLHVVGMRHATFDPNAPLGP